MKFGVIDCCPGPKELVDILEECRKRGCIFTVTSLQRDQEAINWARNDHGCQKSSQEELYAGFIAGRPGFNPANPPGQSTHELRSDGVAYPGPIGRKLQGWQCGIDSTNPSGLIAELSRMGITATVTYPTNPREAHHINIRFKPKGNWGDPRVMRVGMQGKDVRWLNQQLNQLFSPFTDKRYLTGAEKGAAGNKFTNQTLKAVRQFQKDHKQKQDGLVGQATRNQIKVAKRRQKRLEQKLKNQRDRLIEEGKRHNGTYTQKEWIELKRILRRLRKRAIRKEPVKMPDRVPPKQSRDVLRKRIAVKKLVDEAKKNKEWDQRKWARAKQLMNELEDLGIRKNAPAPDAKAPVYTKNSKGENDTRLVVMRTSPQGVDAIKKWESFISVPTNIGDGVWTWGYGHTAQLNSKDIPKSINQKEATALLAKDLAEEYEPAVRRLFQKGGPLEGLFTQNLFDALVSFAYNLGSGFATVSTGFETIQRAIKARDIKALANCLYLYRSPRTQFELGLLRRRLTERNMILKKDYRQVSLSEAQKFLNGLQ